MVAVLVAVLMGAALGEAWEPAILAGIEQQERQRRTQKPEALLREARLVAARRAEGAEQVVRLYLLARAYGIAGDLPSAGATYAEVLRLAPRCYFAHHDLAMLALEREPPDEAAAERALRRALTIHPAFLTGLRKLALLLLRLERSKEAIRFLLRVVDQDPADLQARALLATVLLDQGRHVEAKAQVTQLLRRAPEDPAVLGLQARLLMASGEFDEALRLYRRQAIRSPGDPRPLALYLRALDAKRETGGHVVAEDYLWALEGLLRVERDPARRKALRGAIDEARMRGESDATGGEIPPDPLIARRLEAKEVEPRIRLLRAVYGREKAPEKDLLRALIRRLSPAIEPSARIRMWSLRVLGRHGGYGLVGLIRYALGDPAPVVRPVAVDVLLELALTHEAAHAAAVLALGRHIEDPDPVLAAAARAGIVTLTRAGLDEAEAESEAARREAFLTWWGGPAGAEARVRALERFPEVGDSRPEDLVLPYLLDPDPYVFRAAWRAMAEAARRLGTTRLDPRRRAWLERLPEPDSDDRDPGAQRSRVETWAAARPR